MRVAPYYEKLLQAGLKAGESMEPIIYSGMFDSGVDYLFTLFAPLAAAELTTNTLINTVDLSGLTTKEEIVEELSFSFRNPQTDNGGKPDYQTLTQHVLELGQKQPVLLIVYLGQDGKTDPGLFRFLNRLRNLLGWKFSYTLFLTSRLLLNSTYQSPLIDKVIKRNLLRVLPLNNTNARIVLANYEERYKKKLSSDIQRLVLSLSGGNPGLIKSLYLQAKEDSAWKKPDFLEESLSFRLAEIWADIPKEGQTEKVPKNLENILSYYGYLIKKGTHTHMFTPTIMEFARQYGTVPIHQANNSSPVDLKLLSMTVSQRKVLEYLESHPGTLVSKDTIAQVLWGDAWADKYYDWAIDQLLSTLRDRMTTIHQKAKIVTKKGEGVIFLPKK